jgi:hypothetical protein
MAAAAGPVPGHLINVYFMKNWFFPYQTNVFVPGSILNE